MIDGSAEILFQSFLQEAIVSSSGMGRAVHSLMLSIQHFFCRSRHRPPSRWPEGWFSRGCRGVWHARTMQVSVSWQLPEEVPVNLQGRWSCSPASRWSCAPSRKHGEVSSGTWFRKPGSFFFFFQSQQTGSMFHSHREEDGVDKSFRDVLVEGFH